MSKGNRERILSASVDLFNHYGTVAVTTNHIAKHLQISPGNLYFHFRNKEAIVLELFQRLCDDVYAAWDAELGLSPQEFLERSFEVFWKFRFFHREMYHLRRQDRELTKAWKRHMSRCYVLVKMNYREWIKRGLVRPISDVWEMRALSESLLLHSSAFLGFFESPEKPAARKSVRSGVEHVNRLLAPYYT